MGTKKDMIIAEYLSSPLTIGDKIVVNCEYGSI